MKILSISEEKKKYNTVEDLQDLMKHIDENKEDLFGIDLSENSFSPECIKHIMPAICACSNIEILTFKGIFTTRGKAEVEESLECIVNCIGKLEKVTYFDISDNALSMHGMKILAPLIEGMSDLKYLVLNNNGIGIDGGECLAEALTVLAGKGSALERIELGRNRLETSAKPICNALRNFMNIDTIKLYQNSINAVTMADILLLLQDLDIRVFDVADNFLLERGAFALAKCLNRWNIESINVSDCLLGDAGVKALAIALEHSVRIQGDLSTEMVLDMAYNDISGEVLDTVFLLLQKIPQAKVVLTGNTFTLDEVHELSKKLHTKGTEIVFEEEELTETSEEEKDQEKIEEEIVGIQHKLAEISLAASAPIPEETEITEK